jgi:Mg2+-importing ATPase
VKRLDAIEDFGAMTVLCTDKTGTLTAGAAALDAALDLDGRPSSAVLELARLNAGLQDGFANPLDAAVLDGAPPVDRARRLGEIPYDFTRKRLSVLVARDGAPPVLITKGALESVLAVCTHAEVAGAEVPIDDVRLQLEDRFERLSLGGRRVLGVASRAMPGIDGVGPGVAAEAGMVLRGLLSFADPPKAGVRDALADLGALGIGVRLVTGDNRHAARHVATAVGLPVAEVVTGADIDGLDEPALAARCVGGAVFAEVQPLHKARIVRALRQAGETVGFLGDGINDAAALHAADVGISVDTAVDVAKQTAAIVLLEKSLDVIADGVRLGRQTFANTRKYVRVTTSANFGNVVSMAVASVFLPFLPLLPRQILLLNFLSDIPATTIAADRVDVEQVERPGRWDIASIRRFMIVFGLLSSVFDIATFAVLRLGFHADAVTFRTGWFVGSTATELVALLVLRTRRPCYRSRPARALLVSSALVGVLTVALPFSPLAGTLGLDRVPPGVGVALLVTTAAYVVANEVLKRRPASFGDR